MIYYRRYSGDYLRKTARLNLTEHGAYSVLVDYYYTDGRPLPLDRDELYMMVRAMRPEDRQAVDKVLALFFARQDDGYHQRRCDQEISISQQARENGKGGGRPPRKAKTGDGNGAGGQTGHGTGDETNDETGGGPEPETGAETGHGADTESGHETQTQTETGHPLAFSLYPLTSNHQPPAFNPQPKAEKPVRAKRAAPSAPVEKPPWLPPEWDDYEQHRREKRQPLTPTARKGAFRKLDRWRREGKNVAEILRESIANGWTGIHDHSTNGSRRKSNASVARAWLGEDEERE